jgi:plastocyanin
MATTQVSPDTNSSPSASAPQRKGRSALDGVILVGLFGAALVYVLHEVQGIITKGSIIPPVLGIAIALLICGAVAATRWRWSMVIPLVLTTVVVAFQLSPGSFPLYGITHPGDYPVFAPIVLHIGFAIMAVVGLAVKLVQTIRRQTPHAPHWLNPAVAALTGLTLGMLLLGAIAQPSSAGAATNTTATGTETVHLTGSSFSPNIVALHKGDTLTMIGDSPVPHVIANGTWSSSKPMPGTEAGAPAINNVSVDGKTVVVGPFTTPGTYQLYCTVHPGMVLTVIVQ